MNELARRAVSADVAGSKEEAVELYLKLVDTLAEAMKLESDRAERAKYTQHMLEYVERAEALTRTLQTVSRRKLVARRVAWSDIAGLSEAKDLLRQAAVLPRLHPELFDEACPAWTRVMLFGPPGTGKTLLASALATEVGASFVQVSAADAVSKWQGESEKLIREIFESASASGACVLFIDEADSLMRARTDDESDGRRSIKTELLLQLQNMREGLIVVAATNTPWEIDIAIARRFERKIYVPMPDQDTRRELVRLKLQARPDHLLDPFDVEELVRQTDGCSCADVDVMFRAALNRPVVLAQQSDYFALRGGEYHPLGKEPPCGACPREKGVCGACGAERASVYDLGAPVHRPALSMEHFAPPIPSVPPERLRAHADWASRHATL